MISREEYIRNLIRGTARNVVETTLRSTNNSARFLTRPDVGEIDKEIERITDEIVDSFVQKLKAGGYTEAGKEAPREEFEALFLEAVTQYFERGSKT